MSCRQAARLAQLASQSAHLQCSVKKGITKDTSSARHGSIAIMVCLVRHHGIMAWDRKMVDKFGETHAPNLTPSDS